MECTPKIEQCVSLMNITYAVTAGNSKENLLFFCFANNETKLTKRINFRVNFDKKVPQFEPDSNIIWFNFERRKVLLFGRVFFCYCTNEFYNYYRILCTPLSSLLGPFLNDNV